LNQIEISQDKGISLLILALMEMKAYIGGDEMIELVQKTRGFKNYRELYTRKIQELENTLSTCLELKKDVKVIFF
jgi:intraflagellar transport protein 81